MSTRPLVSLALLLAGAAALLLGPGLLGGCAPASAAAPLPEAAAADGGSGFSLSNWPPADAARRGQAVFAQYCIGCHGPMGEGDGPAAPWLDPLPRNFQKGYFKFRSTPSGELPTEDDLIHVVRCGLKGSSMPGFPLLGENEVRDVVAWVRYLAAFGLVKDEVEYVMEDDELSLEEVLADDFDALVEEVLGDAYEAVWPVVVPPEPPMTEASVARGGELYQAQCVACHGASGRGDGPSSFQLRDWKDASILPRDFTTGIFRAGSTPRDLFLRMKTGLNGTPMPSYGTTPDDDLWAIVHYIMSLVDEDSRVEPHPTSCEAHQQRATLR